jgi:hypothetical protein
MREFLLDLLYLVAKQVTAPVWPMRCPKCGSRFSASMEDWLSVKQFGGGRWCPGCVGEHVVKRDAERAQYYSASRSRDQDSAASAK